MFLEVYERRKGWDTSRDVFKAEHVSHGKQCYDNVLAKLARNPP